MNGMCCILNHWYTSPDQTSVIESDIDTIICITRGAGTKTFQAASAEVVGEVFPYHLSTSGSN